MWGTLDPDTPPAVLEKCCSACGKWQVASVAVNSTLDFKAAKTSANIRVLTNTHIYI